MGAAEARVAEERAAEARVAEASAAEAGIQENERIVKIVGPVVEKITIVSKGYANKSVRSWFL